MYVFVSIVYVRVCLFLISVVLLQQGRGGGMGSALGGSSQTVFGGSGAGNILTRITSVCAALFMILSAVLAFMSSGSDSTLEEVGREIEARQAQPAVAPETGTEAETAPSEGSSDPAAESPTAIAPSEEPAPAAEAAPAAEEAPAPTE